MSEQKQGRSDPNYSDNEEENLLAGKSVVEQPLDVLNKRKTKEKAKDPQGEEKVVCRFCLGKEMRLSSLPTHVRIHHKKMYSKVGRATFIKVPGQLIAHDPAY